MDERIFAAVFLGGHGLFFETAGFPKIHPDEDRVMICGSMAL
ncbi:hypothetical protein [Bartonella jaculi]